MVSEFTQLFKATPPAGQRTPVILVSVSESEEDRHLGRQGGQAEGFPSTSAIAPPANLLQSVSALMERRA